MVLMCEEVNKVCYFIHERELGNRVWILTYVVIVYIISNQFMDKYNDHIYLLQSSFIYSQWSQIWFIEYLFLNMESYHCDKLEFKS